MKSLRLFLIICLLLLASSCATGSNPRNWTYSHTYDREFDAQPETCSFKVSSLAPTDGKYIEIGTLNFTGLRFNDNSIESFKNSIKKYVCEAGGDHVIGVVNSYGFYVQGIVLKKVGK